MTNTITTPTPHIGAKNGDFAKTVLMSGDPLRAKYIAEHFLTNAIEVTNIRGMLGFTGEYKGARISIMGHGMGIPSAAIYVTELFLGYGVEAIIRAGSCGAIRPDVNVNDIVIALGASTDSNINRIHFNGYDFAAIADYELLNKLVTTAQNQTNTKIHVGNLFSTDIFYTPESKILDILEGQGILGVDMEAAGIYGLAAKHGRKAATICTVSDHIRKQEYLSAEARQTGFTTMIEIALESAIAL